MPSNYSIYVKKDKPHLIELFNRLTDKGELSDFVIEAIEMHHEEILQKRMESLEDQTKYWTLVAEKVRESGVKEKARIKMELQEQIEIVENYIENMVYQERDRPNYNPPYSTTAKYIEEDCGLILRSTQIEKFYKMKLKGIEIDYLKELTTKGWE